MSHVAHDSRAAIAAFVARPVGVLMLLAVILTLGIIAFVRIPVQLLPGGWGSQTFTIVVPNANSNPRETEDRITRPVEEQVRTISGVRSVRSVTTSDRARIRVEFGGNQDLDVAYTEIRDRMEKIRPTLPRGAERYWIFRFNLDEGAPIYFGGLLFDLEPTDPRVNDLCENVIKRAIEGVDGVARMDIRGTLEESIRILLDVDKVRAHRLDLMGVVERLARDNFASPAGRVEEGGARFLLRVDSRFRDLDEIREVPITGTLKVKDVADVRRVQAIRETLTRISDLQTRTMKFALTCSVSKVAGANTVETCERLVAAMKELERRPDLAGLRFDPWFNQGRMIQASLAGLETAAKDGAWIAIAVLLFFLRRVRLTLLIALAIPVSLLATLVSLYFTGASFNIVSMAGITLAVGSLVDNAVVVVENVHRKREGGTPAFRSIVDGAGEVGVAITLATLTSIVVFVPLIFLGEEKNLRIAMAALGYPFSVALLASLMAALVFIPVALNKLEGESESRWARKLASVRERMRYPLTWLASRAGRRSGRLTSEAAGKSAADRSILLRVLKAGCGRLLAWSLRNRFYAAAAALLLMLSTSVPMGAIEISSGGEGDQSGIRIQVDLPQNMTLSQASDELAVYESVLLEHADEIGFRDLSCDFSRTSGQLDLWFGKSFTKREREDLLVRVRELLPKRATSDARVEGGKRDASSPTGVQFLLTGRDSDVIARVAENFKDVLSTVPVLTNVRTELERGRPELRVHVDRERAQRLSLNPTLISGAIEWGLRGYMLSRIQEHDAERALVIQYEGAESSNLEALADTKLLTPFGGEVALSAVATFEAAQGYAEIYRRDGKTALAVTADVLTGDAKSAAAAARRALEPLLLELPREVEVDEGGALRDFERNEQEVLSSLWLSILLVYVVMAVMFESVILPLSILTTIPFAFFGAYWTLYLTKTPMDELGLLGLIVLVGVVVNHGVVLVDRVNALRVREGLDRDAAVLQGSRDRLRPVLMTSLTTIGGLIPMALGEPGATQGISYTVLARAVCGGLATSTFFTLWVVPLFYTFFDDLSLALQRTFRTALHVGLGGRGAAAQGVGFDPTGAGAPARSLLGPVA